jgi:hypothetical protein
MKILYNSTEEFTQEQVIHMVSKFSLFDRAIAKNTAYATEELIMIIKAVEFVETL